MIVELEAFTLADPVFFDSQRRWGGDDHRFPAAVAPVPAGWRREEQDVWVLLMPLAHRLPQQGWKVHVSACPDNAARVLETSVAYCVEVGVPFKFLRSPNVLRAHSLKYADRGASGKLITIYPAGTDQLHRVLTELSAALAGEPGPYLLTDLRWGDGPLYVRYGAFILMHCPGDNGEPVPALALPDGTLVPDRRTPVFSVPEWVTVPEFLRPHLAARDNGPVDFPYRPETALHFSNGGGVYLGRRTADGSQVVLKEARPYAGLDIAGRDAVTRLRAERAALTRLAGVTGVPVLYDYRRVWEHEFLVQEYRRGESLFSWLAQHHPLVRALPTDEEVRRYTDRAVAVAGQIERIVTEIHDRGVVIGDLHPNNILVDDDDTVTLIDFEVAADVAAGENHRMGFPGFRVLYKSGFAADRHCLAAIKLWLLLPIIELSALVSEKLEQLLALAADRFPLPPGYLDGARAELLADRPPPGPGPLGPPPPIDLDGDPAWTVARKSLAEAVLASATPERHDRLFPGGVQQFSQDTVGGGVGFGHGAAGVLWALDAAGAGRFPHHEQWLVEAAERMSPVRVGFYDGLYGLAYVLDSFGHDQAAATVLARAVAGTRQLSAISLHSGLAGAGLALLHFADRPGDAGHADLVDQVAHRLGDAVRSGAAHGVDEVPGRDGKPVAQLGTRAGLMRGWSGVALFFLRLHQRTGDPGHLDLAVEAVHRDLALCRSAPDDSLQVDAGFALLPYLEVGSAGIALVAAELLTHRADDRIAAAVPRLIRACRPELVFETQVFQGRAGLMAALALLARCRPDLVPGDAVSGHLRRLPWHALSYQGELAFPGTKLRRLSMDLATGNAGLLLAVRTAVDDSAPFLPFLGHR